jgi:GT2 family glycosyltransferase
MKIAIVILNFNGAHFLKKFLPKVLQYSHGNDIIVADNASNDDSKAIISNDFPSVKWIQNASNGGFALGYNEALGKLQGKYDAYLLLNSDIEVTEAWTQPLIKALNDPEIVAVQPKILSFNHRQYFEHAGACGGFLDNNYFSFCRGRIFDFCEEDLGQYNYQTEIHWSSGAAMLVRAKAFHEVGGFDADFFAHMEEIDLCCRLRAKGFKIICQPESVVYHVGGGTLPYESPQKIFLNFRNNLFLLVKNHQGLLAPKLFWRMLLDGIAAFKFLSEGKFHFFWKVFLSHMALYAHLPSLLKKRQNLKSDNTQKISLFHSSIIWNYFFKKNKKFSSLNQRQF